MVEFVDTHESDVIVPRMVGLDGRWVDGSTYAETVPDADLEKVLKTLSPQKMFRRSLLLDFGIRFPQEKVRLEDGMMLARAYFKASRVSVLGDYDYYYIRARDDGQNISSRPLDPTGYTWSIGEVSRLIQENDPDPDRASRIILDLYLRKCLKMYTPKRFSNMADIDRDQWIHEHQLFVDKYISSDDPGLAAVWPDLSTVWFCSATVPLKVLRRKTKTVADVYIRSTSERTKNRARVHVTEETTLPAARRSTRPYETVRGNFSVGIRQKR